MDNSVSVDLSAGNTVDLMGNLKIIVADDSNFLRFALSAERTGTYEVRGTVFPVTDEGYSICWNFADYWIDPLHLLPKDKKSPVIY